jgi:hypothetical protein
VSMTVWRASIGAAVVDVDDARVIGCSAMLR